MLWGFMLEALRDGFSWDRQWVFWTVFDSCWPFPLSSLDLISLPSEASPPNLKPCPQYFLFALLHYVYYSSPPTLLEPVYLRRSWATHLGQSLELDRTSFPSPSQVLLGKARARCIYLVVFNMSAKFSRCKEFVFNWLLAIVECLSDEEDLLTADEDITDRVPISNIFLRSGIVSQCVALIKYDIFTDGRICILALEALEYLARILGLLFEEYWQHNLRMQITAAGLSNNFIWVRTIDFAQTITS